MRRLLVILALCLSASSCVKQKDWAERLADNDYPLTALHADAVSTRYDADYWRAQKTRNTWIWKHAVTFCETHNDYVNCYPVNKVHGPRVAKKTRKKSRKKRNRRSGKKNTQPLTWTAVQKRQSKKQVKKLEKKPDNGQQPEKSEGSPDKDTSKDQATPGNKTQDNGKKDATKQGQNKNKSTDTNTAKKSQQQPAK